MTFLMLSPPSVLLFFPPRQPVALLYYLAGDVVDADLDVDVVEVAGAADEARRCPPRWTHRSAQNWWGARDFHEFDD